MAAKVTLETGVPLEARVQRLFMCQGAYAERGLILRTGRGSSKQVTDVDVVAHDYSINFHHRRSYAECKGGRHRSPLDRIVWVRGVKEAIAADYPHLILDHCDAATAQFAKSLGVEVLQASGLAALESALHIGPKFWPGRANHLAYAGPEDVIKALIDRRARGGVGEWLTQASDVWRDASALAFSYGRLNALLGSLVSCTEMMEGLHPNADETLAMSYAVGALLVRLSQYVLFAASDTLAMSPSEREQYLAERLTAGNLDIEQSRRLLESAINMVSTQLRALRLEALPTWDVDHLLAAPGYARPFVKMVERAIAEGEHSRVLPLAMELRLFGYVGDEGESGRLIPRARHAVEPTGVVVAFARQSLGLPEHLTRGPAHLISGVKPLQPAPNVGEPVVHADSPADAPKE